jgi:hypothetical protein
VPSSEELEAQVARVLSSSGFRGSTAVRRLLQYLAAQAADRPGEAVKEYEIATAGLGRGNEFDPRVDAVVRLTAARLRAKLAEYYVHEGAEDPVLLRMPKGAYLLAASYRVGPREPEPRAEAPQPAPERRRSRWGDALGRTRAVAALLAALCGVLSWQNLRLRREVGEASRRAPHVEHLWGSLFGNGQPVTLVPSDGNLLLLSSLTRRPTSLREYRGQDYPASLLDEHVADAAVRQVVGRHMSTFLTTSHDSIGIARIAAVMDRSRVAFTLTYARDARLEPDTEDNLVLLGSRMENPWVSLFDHKVNFAYEWDAQEGRGVLRNRGPRAGEKEAYAPKPGKSYATVVYAPRPMGTGRVLILGGTDITAVEVGARALTDEASAAALYDALGLDLDHPVPYFEVLLSARHLTDIPYNSEIVAYRIAGGTERAVP